MKCDFGVNKKCILFILTVLVRTYYSTEPTCSKESCDTEEEYQSPWKQRYILYDVNPGEGFNLRRDVYMRIASLVKLLRTKSPEHNWSLVLPPWGPLYHWKSEELNGLQFKIPWRKFFDLESLSRYVPVMEFEDILKDTAHKEIDEVVYLQHYADTFSNNDWTEKYSLAKCLNSLPYLSEGKLYKGYFWGYDDVSAKKFNCLSIQGHVSTLLPFIQESTSRSILIDRAEVILHDHFGDSNYWKIRRSMRFAKHLVATANSFRKNHLNSTDEEDGTDSPPNWQDEQPSKTKIKGGPYLAVHLRRQDYIYARPTAVPAIPHAAKQIRRLLKKLNLSVAYVATDGSAEEFEQLKEILPEAIRFPVTPELLEQYLDGGLAIIDQWICAHARYFIGSFESTFSFRIQEEREILGFSPDTTFNSFCGDGRTNCDQPTRWEIVY